MTQDYKDNLLKYLTGNLDLESGDNIPNFEQESEIIDNNLAEDIKNKLTNNNNATNVIALGKIYNEMYNEYLIYGYYIDNENKYYGFIYLVDNNLNEIQMITEFSSGSKLFPITALNQDENNNLYGLTFSIGEYEMISKVLLFNNIFASGIISGNYEAILRNDYIIPYHYNQAPYRQNRIIKSPESATYYIIFNEDSKERIIKFTINVGAQNEWTEAILPIAFYMRFDVILDKSGGNEVLLMYGIDTDNPSSYYEYKIDGENITLIKKITLPYLAQFLSQIFVKDINNVFMFLVYSSVGKAGIYKVNNNQIDKIYEFNLVYGDTGYKISYGTIFELNNGVFFYLDYRNASDTKLYAGYIKEDNTYTINLIGTYDGIELFAGLYDYVDFYYIKKYNLIEMYFPLYSETNTTKKITFDYNSINYNGEEYTDVNSLVPNKARLYDNNNKMIFARNLYNKVINANTTISTLNIPNTNLNNIIIYNQSLIGETNYVLMNNQEEITKNIYENLNINFYNTLKMINNNDIDNPIFNQNGSNRINSSVSKLNDYDNAKATKIRINYSDNTTKIVSIEFYPIQNYYYTKFSIYIDKLISSIDFISNDEETIYNTIRPNFIVGKYYTINQSVRIDERIQTQPVLYNNEQIYYNNEEIYY